MNLEFHIARRMAHSTDGRSRSVMERIAIFAVALSVAVMVVSLAVIVGFKTEISEKMSAFSAHVVVTDVGGVQRLNAEPFTENGALRRLIASHDGFVRMQRYAERGGIVRTNEAVEGVVLKGVGVDYDGQPVSEWLVEGALPRVGDSIRTKDVLISR
ncbi:MAG: ABC transporter permease, partial [Alistipes sp.]|nr:ABC transporter permease [Alistipes sp.]